ncbi:DNA primase [bacterium]|nr:DNA primase [bacterium]
MSFSQEFTERVRQASDILDVVSQYVTLKKRGGNWFGLCPFHSEKTGSFSVNPAKGIFHCFGCGAGGSVINFVMMRENMRFPEAVESLAKRAGIEIPQDTARGEKSGREKLYLAVSKGQSYFRQNFKRHQLPQYYMKNRGFSSELCERMELGYVPDSWDGFAKTIAGPAKDFMTVGLVRQRESGGHYDYFRSRLIFPIKDLSGRICGFGGRYLGDINPDIPKYLNSPESPIYKKGGMLYALEMNREAVRKAGFVYLVEGYTDLLRLVSEEVENCCAGLGTAFTIEQARLLRRYTEKVTLLYDGDEAGIRAAVKTGGIIVSAGMNVDIAVLPPEHDPDSYLREKGGDGLKGLETLSLFAFQYHHNHERALTSQGRESLAKEMLEHAANLPGEIKKGLALEEIAELLQLPVQALRSEIRRIRRSQNSEADEIIQDKLTFSLSERPERDLIQLLLIEPEICGKAYEELSQDMFQNAVLGRLFIDLKKLWLKSVSQPAHELMNEYDDMKITGFIAQSLETQPPGDSIELLTDYISNLKNKNLKKQSKMLKEEIIKRRQAGQSADDLLIKLRDLKR